MSDTCSSAGESKREGGEENVQNMREESHLSRMGKGWTDGCGIGELEWWTEEDGERQNVFSSFRILYIWIPATYCLTNHWLLHLDPLLPNLHSSIVLLFPECMSVYVVLFKDSVYRHSTDRESAGRRVLMHCLILSKQGEETRAKVGSRNTVLQTSCLLAPDFSFFFSSCLCLVFLPMIIQWIDWCIRKKTNKNSEWFKVS